MFKARERLVFSSLINIVCRKCSTTKMCVQSKREPAFLIQRMCVQSKWGLVYNMRVLEHFWTYLDLGILGHFHLWSYSKLCGGTVLGIFGRLSILNVDIPT